MGNEINESLDNYNTGIHINSLPFKGLQKKKSDLLKV